MKIINYWKPIIVSLIILLASITSGDNINKVNFIRIPHFDKFVHFCFYLSLSITLIFSINRNTLLKKFDQKLIVIITTVSYGLLMEMLQYLIASNRSAEFLDVIANTVGCIFGVMLFNYIKKYKISKFL